MGDWAGGGCVGGWAGGQVGKWARGGAGPMIRHTAEGRVNADFSIQHTADSRRHGPLRSSRSG